MNITVDPRFCVKPGNGGYTFDGKPLTRISSISNVIDKPALVPWAVRLAVEHLQEHPLDFSGATRAHADYFNSRAAFGTSSHAMLEAYINRCIKENNGEPIEPETNPFSQVWQTWKHATDNKWTFLATETPVYDEEYMIGGRFDFLYKTQDVYGVGDFKNYKKIRNKAPLMQMSAYAYCTSKMSGVKIIESTVLRFSPLENVEIVVSQDLDNDFLNFTRALGLQRYGVTHSYTDGIWKNT